MSRTPDPLQADVFVDAAWTRTVLGTENDSRSARVGVPKHSSPDWFSRRPRSAPDRSQTWPSRCYYIVLHNGGAQSSSHDHAVLPELRAPGFIIYRYYCWFFFHHYCCIIIIYTIIVIQVGSGCDDVGGPSAVAAAQT